MYVCVCVDQYDRSRVLMFVVEFLWNKFGMLDVRPGRQSTDQGVEKQMLGVGGGGTHVWPLD